MGNFIKIIWILPFYEGQKAKMEIFWATKSWRNFLEELKWKVDKFIGIKIIFYPFIFYKV